MDSSINIHEIKNNLNHTNQVALGDEPIIIITDPLEDIIYRSRIKLNDKRTAQIVRNSLDVDEEFSQEIIRKIEADEFAYLNLEYKFKAHNIKYFKKSVKALYENMQLVIETIRDFS